MLFFYEFEIDDDKKIKENRNKEEICSTTRLNVNNEENQVSGTIASFRQRRAAKRTRKNRIKVLSWRAYVVMKSARIFECHSTFFFYEGFHHGYIQIDILKNGEKNTAKKPDSSSSLRQLIK